MPGPLVHIFWDSIVDLHRGFYLKKKKIQDWA